MENKNTRPRVNRPVARKSEKPSDLSNKLRVIPLGGVEEVGINCTVYENSSEMVVVDIGLGFSEFDYYGVDHIVPNI
jgi:ribonuclease J